MSFHHIINSLKNRHLILRESDAVDDAPGIWSGEYAMHRTWNQMRFPADFTTLTGLRLTVLHGGIPNGNPGPDFLHAVLLVNEIRIRGDIEFHLRARNWREHGHSEDPNYANVILHVLAVPPGPSFVPESDYYPKHTIIFREKTPAPSRDITPARCVRECPDSPLSELLNALGWRRLREKALQSQHLLAVLDMNDVCYTKTLRGLGYSHNTLPMELVAQRLPLSLVDELTVHLNHEEQFGFLMGCTGFGGFHDIDLPVWEELSEQFSLVPLRYHQWQVLRHRPNNHPVLRLFAFFRGFQQLRKLFNQGYQTSLPGEYIRDMTVSVSVPGQFLEYMPHRTASIGERRSVEILMNCYLPLWLTDQEADFQILDKWIEQLPLLPLYTGLREFIRTSRWSEVLGESPRNPLQIQGLLYIRNQWCARKRCNTCPVFN